MTTRTRVKADASEGVTLAIAEARGAIDALEEKQDSILCTDANLGSMDASSIRETLKGLAEAEAMIGDAIALLEARLVIYRARVEANHERALEVIAEQAG